MATRKGPRDRWKMGVGLAELPMQMIEEQGTAGLERAHVPCTAALEAGKMGRRELQARDDIARDRQMQLLRDSEQAARVGLRHAQSLARRGCGAAGAGGEGQRRRSSAGHGRRAARRRGGERPGGRGVRVACGVGAGRAGASADVEMRPPIEKGHVTSSFCGRSLRLIFLVAAITKFSGASLGSSLLAYYSYLMT